MSIFTRITRTVITGLHHTSIDAWQLFLENGATVSLSSSDIGLEYLKPEHLNKMFKEKGLLKLQPPR